MSSKADEYRRYGAQALASAEQAASKKEKAELLKIAEVWSELATEQQRDVADTFQRLSLDGGDKRQHDGIIVGTGRRPH